MSRMESINGAEIQFLLWKMKTNIFWFPYGNYKCRRNSIFIMKNENAYFFDNSKLRILYLPRPGAEVNILLLDEYSKVKLF